MPGPPPPPLSSTEGLRLGDVVQVSKLLRSKTDGHEYWWRSFRCVTRVTGKRSAQLLILKMHPDLDRDLYEVDFQERDQVIIKLPEESWPQGVIAIRTKHIMRGLIKLGDD